MAGNDGADAGARAMETAGPRLRKLVRLGLAALATLLVLSSGIAFAAGTPQGQLVEEAESEPAVEAGQVQPPDAEQVAEGIAAVEREEAARERELQTPEAIRRREQTRRAFAGISAEESQQLLLSSFSDQLAALNAEPARFLGDVELVKTAGETAATVRSDGEGFLFEAGIPVRAEDEEGDLKKVDLGLVASEGGFEPANPLTEVRIPESADETIDVGEEGLGIRAADAGESGVRRLGDKNAYYPDVQTDTDLLVAPTASGVELFDQLRSVDSPESLDFQIELPAGAELRADSSGGAEVIANGKTIAEVPAPRAVDAEGTHVPVELQAQGSTITLHVPHREQDFSYPILLDPALSETVSENYLGTWYWGTNLEALSPAIWHYGTNDPTETWILHNYYCLTVQLCSPSGRGLFLSSLNRNIPANIYAQWYYYVPGTTTYIPSIYPYPSAEINGFNRNNEGCTWNSYPQPHDYDGSFNAAGEWQWFETDRAQWTGIATMFTQAKGIAFGISSGGGVNIPCWRDVMAGGASVVLADPEAPTLTSPPSGIPTGWVSDAKSFSITGHVYDPGLGVQNVKIAPDGQPITYYVSPGSQCPGTATHPCPAYLDAPFSLNADQFGEGERIARLSANDPTGKTSGTYQWQMKVDRTPPEVTLEGQLATATKETGSSEVPPGQGDELSLPVYTLLIEATDGSNGSPAAKRSGVKDIKVFLDGTPMSVPWGPQSCPGSSCPMIETYTLKMNDVEGSGEHTLTVITTDQVGNERKREVEFKYFPATGMKDEYVMEYFPLPDGQGDESGEEHPDRPELAVNVMNGNLVFRQKDVEVEGPAVDLEVERYYNSQLPEAEGTEWGEGWTLAQTPTLEPEETGGAEPPSKASMVRTSGALESAVGLPAESGGERFDAKLQARVTKEPGGGYEVADESGETGDALAFDKAGKVKELRTDGYAKVDYDYEGGDLAEITVEDPASAGRPAIPFYSTDFGSSGSGNGQFNTPVGLAAEAAGNIFVADTPQ